MTELLYGMEPDARLNVFIVMDVENMMMRNAKEKDRQKDERMLRENVREL
jgi:hypothetical protein